VYHLLQLVQVRTANNPATTGVGLCHRKFGDP